MAEQLEFDQAHQTLQEVSEALENSPICSCTPTTSGHGT